MRIVYITNSDKNSQCDFQEVSTLHGLREVLGNDCIDYPRKKIMYGEYDESPKPELHGKGFSLLTYPIEDISDRTLQDIDFVLYGVTDAYGVENIKEIEKLARYGVFYLDGHDHSRISRTPCFKRELFKKHDNVYPTGFGIPYHRIKPISISHKNKLFQKTAPPYSLFGPQILGVEGRKLYCFDDEEEYYDDMSRSFFGLTCKKGGWDSLRHYEILAAGSCLLFRDYKHKPFLCSPRHLPCFSYSTKGELESLVNRLLPNGKPSEAYISMLDKQRSWLLKYGTTRARAKKILEILKNEIS